MICNRNSIFIHVSWEEFEGELNEKYNLDNILIFKSQKYPIFTYNYATHNITNKQIKKYTEDEIVDNLIQIIEFLNINKIPWKGNVIKATYNGDVCCISITERQIIFDYKGQESKVINI